MTGSTDPIGFYTSEFTRLAPAVAAKNPEWVTRSRRDAIEAFRRLGFPTPRDEEWRFTNVRPIAETEFVTADLPAGFDASCLDAHRLPGVAAELVFINGRYVPHLSTNTLLPAGVRVESLAAAVASDGNGLALHLGHVADFERQPFTALNTAFWADGAAVIVAPRVAVERPIHLIFVTAGVRPTTGPARLEPPRATVSHPRVIVLAGRDSRASIVESYVGAPDARYLTNAVTEVVLGDHAVVDHVKVQREAVRGFHVATLHALAASNATLTSHSVSFGGGLVRNNVVATLDGEGAECTLNGLYVADDSRLVDNHTTIDHAKPHCRSREVYKGVLGDRARGVFNGKIIVRPDAQRTDAKQTNKALLLSADAQINTKPQLEIFANDVKCTHGAAVGQLDEEALFYLRSRGLPQQRARDLLIQAFAGDVLGALTVEPLRSRLESELLRRLAGSGGVR
jgi:Fe-S cluster assembly protein SufD